MCFVSSRCGFLAQENGGAGSWVVLIAGFGDPDVTKCIGSEDVDDPTEIPELSWSCESNRTKAKSC